MSLTDYAGASSVFGYRAHFWPALRKSRSKTENNPDTEIIGVSGFAFAEHTIKASDSSTPVWNGLTETVDSSSYPDRAIISLTNALGYDAYITNFIIDGKPIRRYKGAIVHDSLRRDDDIRRNGESLFELGNEYVIDATQATRLADYWYKNLGKKKHVYSVSIPGFAPWYSPGDWYTLSLGSAGTNEYISSTVECYDVQCSRTAGDIGSTTLMLREVEENWTKTTLYAARAVTGGSPKRRSQQSNTLIVAASTFDGTYDYKCDGTADDVEIQAAIDYVSCTWGGGTVLLTGGQFTLAATLTMRSSIVLQGVGNATILSPYDNSITTMVDFGSVTNAELNNCTIDGNGASITFTTSAMTVIDGNTNCKCNNVIIQNYVYSCTTGIKSFYLFYAIQATTCTAKTNAVTNSGSLAVLNSFDHCIGVTSCASYANTGTGTDAIVSSFSRCDIISSCSSHSNETSSGDLYSFNACTNVVACSSYDNTTTGIGDVNSFYECTNVSSCTSWGNATAGTNAFIISYFACNNVTACLSYSNTTAGTGSAIYSFYQCTRVTVSSTATNVSALSNEYGYYTCSSVQQCKSADDSNPYTTSYADAGTSNACADTAAGGYNS